MDSVESAFRELRMENCCQQLSDITRHPYQQLLKSLSGRKALDVANWSERIRYIVEACPVEQYPLDAALGHLFLTVLLMRSKETDSFWRADTELQTTIEILNNCYHTPATQHHLGMAWWMRGCLYLQEGQKLSEILQCWQASQEIFKRITTHAHTLDPQHYRTLVHRQHSKINNLLTKPPTKDSSLPNQAATPISDVRSDAAPLLIQNSSPSTIIGVFEDLLPSAGPPTEIIEFQTPVQRLRLPESDFQDWKFKDRSWSLFALPGRNNKTANRQLLRLGRAKKYLIWRIKGDSMNRTGLHDRDYVLVQLHDQAQSGDIVIAQIIQERGLGLVIKRFRLRPDGKGAELLPESHNPKHQPLPFIPHPGSPEKIIGIVLGVFKPHPTGVPT